MTPNGSLNIPAKSRKQPSPTKKAIPTQKGQFR